MNELRGGHPPDPRRYRPEDDPAPGSTPIEPGRDADPGPNPDPMWTPEHETEPVTES